MMDDAALTLADILMIHELLILEFGGMRGVTEHGFGKLEAAVAAPYASMFGEDLYPDLPAKAATLFWGIARSHGFSDGNKRVALVAVLDLLDRHDQDLAVSEEELYAFVIAAADDLTRDEAGGWFREHVRPRRRP
jgi:death-on-curing protein